MTDVLEEFLFETFNKREVVKQLAEMIRQNARLKHLQWEDLDHFYNDKIVLTRVKGRKKIGIKRSKKSSV